MPGSVTVANRFLELANNCNGALTPMQVLKLVYIAHGWTLGLYGRPLIDDEVQAWQYGPVIPRLYNAVRRYRSQPVTGPLQNVRGRQLNEQESDIIQQVFGLYGDMSGPALSRLTHASGTPWHTVYEPGGFGLVIPNDIIEDHYSALAEEVG